MHVVDKIFCAGVCVLTALYLSISTSLAATNGNSDYNPIADFLALLFLLFCVCLLIGLIKPSLVIRWGEKKTRGKVLLIYGSAVFLTLVLFGILIPPESETQVNVNDQASLSPTPTEMQTHIPSITAKKLISDYSSNEIAADKKYKDKIIRVTGEIDHVSKDILKQPYISLSYGCMAYFDEEYENQLIGLSKGDIVTVQCRCDGKIIFVILKDCILVSSTST